VFENSKTSDIGEIATINDGHKLLPIVIVISQEGVLLDTNKKRSS